MAYRAMREQAKIRAIPRTPLRLSQAALMDKPCTVDVAGSERGGQAVAVLVGDEEGMVADRLEVAIVGRLLLGAVDRTLGAIDIEGHALGRRPHPLVLHQFRIEANESLLDLKKVPSGCS